MTSPHKLSCILARARRADINTTLLQALCLLAEWQESTIGLLGSALATTPAAVTGVADHLIRLGLATRLNGLRDRRTVLLTITPAGRDFLAAILGTGPVAITNNQ